jgi:hypothetical protein
VLAGGSVFAAATPALNPPRAVPPSATPSPAAKPDPVPGPADPALPSPGQSELIIGQKILGPDRYGEATGPPLGALAKHTVVLAGAGSGKTVLLYRLVEEAALRGVPSIVVDCANDLCGFDEPKDTSAHWRPGDDALARRFRESTEMVLWTPGKESGNPLTLHPLPDFGAVRGDPEGLQDALLMACAALSGVVAKGAW